MISGMDRNALRPLRYILTNDGLLISGSEVGMINIEEKHILKKGRVGPGELVAINYKEKKFFESAELKDILSNRQDFSEWVESELAAKTFGTLFDRQSFVQKIGHARLAEMEIEFLYFISVQCGLGVDPPPFYL